jgi:alkylated DNA repair protein (DNA oxidative demethylase)
MRDLFEAFAPLGPPVEVMAEGAMLLRGAALPYEKDLFAALSEIIAQSPFRHMVTPGGFTIVVRHGFETSGCACSGGQG